MIEKIEEVTGPARPTNRDGISVISSLYSSIINIPLDSDRALDEHLIRMRRCDRG
jgi:hypothetical protein